MRFPVFASSFVFGVILVFSAVAQEPPQNSTQAHDISGYATMNCIGIEWPITGDANHNATCDTEYRKAGDEAWKKAMPLLRCDSARHNSFSGSIFNLEPAANYEVKLSLNDPDGGAEVRNISVTTRAVPAMPKGGKELHVVPGDGGGDGSAANPFKGIAAAEAAAKPGDIMLLHKGDYGVVVLTKAGAPEKWIQWKSAGDGEAIIRGLSPKAWTWIDGLTFRTDENSPVLEDSRYTKSLETEKPIKTGLTPLTAAANVCVTRCDIKGFHYCIALGRGCNEWYIADNVLEGDNDPINGGLGGEGVELNNSSKNVLAHNSISRVADGVSYPGTDNDIFGNEIFDVSDDGVETDHGQMNNRVWGNRITNPCNAVFSFQPMNCGPWYFVRNQIIMTRGRPWKFAKNMGGKINVDDRFVVLHNTFIFPKNASEYAQCLLNAFSRNNLYIGTTGDLPIFRAAWNKQGGPGRTFTPDWQTDVDYDGYDWDGKAVPFVWDGKNLSDVSAFSSALGIEKHGVHVKAEDIFENWSVPGVDTKLVSLSLKPGSAAVDSGAIVPNINDDFSGNAPDLGALESGQPVPHYGPRR